MAVTFDKTAGVASIPWDGLNKPYRLDNKVTIPVGAVSTDIIQCLPVKAGTLVLDAYVKMITPATATAISATVGDGATADGYDASIDLKGAAGVLYKSNPADTYPAAGGKYYSADDTIDLVVTVNTMTVAAVIEVYANCLDLTRN